MPTLEFCLPADDVADLLRFSRLAGRRGRAGEVHWVWHDTAAGDLAATRLSACETKGRWRLERASPAPAELWAPGTPPPLLAEALEPGGLGPAVTELTSPLMPIAGFQGRRRWIRLDGDEPASLGIIAGSLRSVAEEQPACRLLLEGSARRLIPLSTELAAEFPITVPLASLAAEAIGLARGIPPVPRRSGGPEVPPEASVGEAVALVIGHLTDVILAGVPAVCAAETPEPVHAMRVALRRLRSAMSVFRRVAGGPAFADVKPQLHDLAAALGVARDWDVFLAGTGQDVAAALAGDRRIEAMLLAAHRRRDAAYGNLRRMFAASEFRRLAVSLVQLAALNPWELDADEERQTMLREGAGRYAAGMLSKRHEHMLAPGDDISGLPAEELHALRKQGKRLRYAAEFFAPLHGRRNTRRFVRRVSQLQEALGLLNDGVATAGLMQALRGGSDRQFAAGAVQGFAAARSTDARSAIARTWTKFRRTEPFWD